jgi:hypothetical protein
MVRQLPLFGEALEAISSLRVGIDGYLTRTTGVLGDITWRKWHDVLTDEDPRCSSSFWRKISAHYKALPKGRRYATVSTGFSSTLAL